MEKQIIRYKSVDARKPDSQYENLLRETLNYGNKKTSIHASLSENENSGHKYSLELPCRLLSYDLTNGVPVSPIRDLGKYKLWQGAIGEIIGFINGARTLEQLMSFGCPESFWKRWVTEEKCARWGLPEGDLGPGSYGPMLTAMPLANGKTFNQIDALISQMKQNPLLRTNLLTTWYPPFALGDKAQGSPRQVVVAPCHGNIVQFDVMDDRTVNMTVYQRSSDNAVGLVLNLTEWVAIGMMVAYCTDTQFTYYGHVLPNPQMYDIQKEAIEKLLLREPRTLPSLYLRPKRDIVSITDFRVEDFELEDYNPYPWMQVPTLI
jgi:thymidylate synthase